jgi:hypothetical protein
MSNSATKLTKEDIARETAKLCLADKAYLALLGKGQPAKLRQVAKSVEIEGVTPRLVRSVMAESDRFDIIDRRWAPSIRYGDTRRPFERVLADLLVSAGVPVSLELLAQELGQIYGRPAQAYEQMLPRILSDRERFFNAGALGFGLAQWLLEPTSDEEADVIFDNYLSQDQVDEYSGLCSEIDWDAEKISESAAAMLKKCKQSVPVKILALLAWRSLQEDFEPIDFYAQLVSGDQILLLSDQKAYPATVEKDFIATLGKLAEEVALLPMEAEEEEAEGPVTLSDTDKEEIVSMILSKGSASAEELIEAVVEVGSDEPAFAGTLELLKEAIKDDERIMWVGGTRWSKVETFPDEVQLTPPSLEVPPTPPFETPEGDVYDQELEIDGFEGDLKTGIYDPLVEDVDDEDPALTNYQPNGASQRCVLKYHHKTEGTFPLCQINPDFFGAEPEIIPITLIDEGKRKQAYVNNDLRLIFGLKDFFKDITEFSGAVFVIEKTKKPGEFRYRFDGEVEEQLLIDTDRSLELLEIRNNFESKEMPLFDVITDILEQRRQGMTFAQLVNEVNLIRRTSRLVIASILSSYHCYHTRGKSGLWQYDEKKRSQGFNKIKRKYVKKD